jgi:hypothetical protein
MSETLPLNEIIRHAIKSGQASMHTQVPGKVVSYDADSGRAKIQLIVSHVTRDPATNERSYYRPAQLVNVPVVFPSVLTWPLSKGDPGWVQFAERSMDEYKANGGNNTEPRDARRFDLTDAVFSPCYFRGEYDATDDAVVLSTEDGPLKARGGSGVATFPVGMSRLIQQWVADHISSNYNVHIHQDPISGSTGAVTITQTPPATDEFDSSNMEAEQ